VDLRGKRCESEVVLSKGKMVRNEEIEDESWSKLLSGVIGLID